jgi:S-adenosylmethionine:tRNA ribosyltransferase-isomerase
VNTPERGILATDALITGFHAPRASHLALLSGLAGSRTIELAYRAALRYRYLWHEFGDSHLLFAR